MGTGAITTAIDVAQLVLYAFWLFFFSLIYYLLRENHREGYPMDTDRGVQEGWPGVPTPKLFKLASGKEVWVPNDKVSPQTLNARPIHGFSGAPLEPVGNPLTAGVGPGSWSDRADVPDVDYHFHPKIVPLRARPEFGVSEKDTDPRGALVYGTDGEIAGTVTELWLDTAEIAFRYFEVTLADGGRKIMLPWGFARITRQGPLEVHALQAHQFAGIPALKAPDTITILEEEKIQAYFGAGLLYAEPERADPLV